MFQARRQGAAFREWKDDAGSGPSEGYGPVSSPPPVDRDAGIGAGTRALPRGGPRRIRFRWQEVAAFEVFGMRTGGADSRQVLGPRGPSEAREPTQPA